ncbi:hypothetical protein HSBAA_15170 [Vreelandella sulfidaeris]|uniref:Uncharacterized protein n=1 Tax=Vreelandella sulfidaeris TaxID=115553 RepID=A0A455U6V2_9GAMM|nr:hypothetical protein HSBAA_15170 [Halomonas sulfidaeris]
MTYVMEWQMVWKDVLIGFTVAGVIAAFVPESFFHGLFPGAGQTEGELGFLSASSNLNRSFCSLFLPLLVPWGIFPWLLCFSVTASASRA